MTYRLFNDGITQSVTTNNGATFVPLDPDNTDYQAFLAWKAEGNEPLPADEPEQS